MGVQKRTTRELLQESPELLVLKTDFIYLSDSDFRSRITPELEKV